MPDKVLQTHWVVKALVKSGNNSEEKRTKRKQRNILQIFPRTDAQTEEKFDSRLLTKKWQTNNVVQFKNKRTSTEKQSGQIELNKNKKKLRKDSKKMLVEMKKEKQKRENNIKKERKT